jgi:hypothetical protein
MTTIEKEDKAAIDQDGVTSGQRGGIRLWFGLNLIETLNWRVPPP